MRFSKGFLSSLIILVLSLSLFSAVEFSVASAKIHGEYEQRILAIEKKNYLEKEIQHGFADTLRYSFSSDREEAVWGASERLADYEKIVEKEYGLDLWCGVVNEHVIEEMVKETQKRRAPAKCSTCWDFSEYAFDAGTKRLYRRCASFVDADAKKRKMRISRGSLVLTKDPVLMRYSVSGEWVLGATAYDPENEISYVIILPEATEVEPW
ncbi:MAG: hypothetical protein QXP42_02995 [Candidatus Micrarchaeia archaeon]